ncbi:hypothetical protein OC835_002968 [Tilletia horrida]|nr:hypothetical protein OC835_002968 [Tilletia horrida]
MDPTSEPATVANAKPSPSIVTRWQLIKAYFFGSIFQALFSLLPLYRLTRWRYGFPPGIRATHLRIKIDPKAGHWHQRRLKLIILEPGLENEEWAKRKGGPVPVLINAHGSGFVLPCHGTDVDLLALTADKLGICCIDADYRHAPAHPFPAPIDDIIEVVKWVQAQPDRFDVDRIVLSGFSAGGNIVMGAAAVLAREAELNATTPDHNDGATRSASSSVANLPVLPHRGEGKFRFRRSTKDGEGGKTTDPTWPTPSPLAGLVLFYPPTDLSIPPYLRPPAPNPHVDVGISTSGPSRRLLDGCYLRTLSDQEDWRASPLRVAPHLWPAHVWIGCGDADPLYVQARAFVDKLNGTPEEDQSGDGDQRGKERGPHPDLVLYTAPRMAHAWEKMAKKGGLGWPEREEAYRQYVAAVGRSIV